MKRPAWKLALYLFAALALAGLVTFFVLPGPLLVDAGEVTTGPMEVTVSDQGETRAHDRFVIAAPVSGRLMRMELHDGDTVSEGQLLAQIAPLPQSIRERQEQRARIDAAEAMLREASEHARHAQDDLALAKIENARTASLVRSGGLPASEGDRARNLEITAVNELQAARFRVASARAQVEVARSGLVAEQIDITHEGVVDIRSPIAGRVLRIDDPSERVVAAGTPLLTIGDLGTLEVVIELLSSEAMKVSPGMAVRLEGYGGDAPLRARVRLVEPLAFTKVSALGVEEKRTNVVADLIDPPGALGHGYRVNAQIVIWRSERATKVPESALFRCGDGAWCAFVIEGARARLRRVRVGRRNALEAEVLGELEPGDRVVRHPGNDLSDGARVRLRARPVKLGVRASER